MCASGTGLLDRMRWGLQVSLCNRQVVGMKHPPCLGMPSYPLPTQRRLQNLKKKLSIDKKVPATTATQSTPSWRSIRLASNNPDIGPLPPVSRVLTIVLLFGNNPT